MTTWVMILIFFTSTGVSSTSARFSSRSSCEKALAVARRDLLEIKVETKTQLEGLCLEDPTPKDFH